MIARSRLGGWASGRRPFCLAAALAVIALGLLVRWPRNGLPFWLTKYAGSLLWGAMVYWLIAACFPKREQRGIAVMSAILAVAVETSRLFHTPWLDQFRLTLAGALLLGRVFSPWNIAAYFAGIVIALAADHALARQS